MKGNLMPTGSAVILCSTESRAQELDVSRSESDETIVLDAPYTFNIPLPQEHNLDEQT